MSPKISVIMPVYNSAPYLRRALDSVCDQTFNDLEILCINDGSTDESPMILAEYAARDRRIRLIDHGKNKGYACAMNSGFDTARGETIGIVDSDDAISKNFYADLWNIYEGAEYDIVKGRRVDCDLDGRWHEKDINAHMPRELPLFTYHWQAAIYKTDLIRRYNLELSLEITTGQDTLFLYQLMGYEPRIAFTDKPIYFYLRNGASMTKEHPPEYYLADNIKIAKLQKKYLPAYPGESQRRKMFGILIHYLDGILNKQFASCDWSPYLAELKDILSDDHHYAPQQHFPFLRHALEARTVQELKLALKIATNCLVASSLREGLRGKGS